MIHPSIYCLSPLVRVAGEWSLSQLASGREVGYTLDWSNSLIIYIKNILKKPQLGLSQYSGIEDALNIEILSIIDMIIPCQ